MELKSCPFCKALPKDGVHKTYEEARCMTISEYEPGKWILSHFCDGISGIIFYGESREEVIEKWNRRATPWINVKDRLPTPEDGTVSGHILVSNGHHVIEALWDAYKHVPKGMVTDWMPMPEAPEVWK